MNFISESSFHKRVKPIVDYFDSLGYNHVYLYNPDNFGVKFFKGRYIDPYVIRRVSHLKSLNFFISTHFGVPCITIFAYRLHCL